MLPHLLPSQLSLVIGWTWKYICAFFVSFNVLTLSNVDFFSLFLQFHIPTLNLKNITCSLCLSISQWMSFFFLLPLSQLKSCIRACLAATKSHCFDWLWDQTQPPQSPHTKPKVIGRLQLVHISTSPIDHAQTLRCHLYSKYNLAHSIFLFASNIFYDNISAVHIFL